MILAALLAAAPAWGACVSGDPSWPNCLTGAAIVGIAPDYVQGLTATRGDGTTASVPLGVLWHQTASTQTITPGLMAAGTTPFTLPGLADKFASVPQTSQLCLVQPAPGATLPAGVSLAGCVFSAAGTATVNVSASIALTSLTTKAIPVIILWTTGGN